MLNLATTCLSPLQTCRNQNNNNYGYNDKVVRCMGEIQMNKMKLQYEFLIFFNSQNDKIFLFLKIMVGNVVVHEKIVRLISLLSCFMVNFTKAPILMWQGIVTVEMLQALQTHPKIIQ